MKMPHSSSEESGPPQATDAELIREIKSGRRESFDQLVRRYQRMVYAIAYRMTSNHQDADDLAQETFMAAYRAIGRFDERRSFSAYLSRIAINLSLNHLRKRKRWLRIWSQKSEQTGEALTGGKGPDLQKNLEQRELLNKLTKAMDLLPPHQKAVLVLRVYQEMSYQDIAKTLRISTGTVMSRLYRARTRLRAQLKGLI